MMKFRFLQAGALGALVSALLLTGMPAAAQDGNRGGREARVERRAAPQSVNRATAQREVRWNRAERPTVAPRQAAAPGPARSGWSGRSRNQGAAAAPSRNQGSSRNGSYTARSQSPAAAAAPTRNSSYTAPRDRSYGAATRGNSAAGRQSRDVASRQQRTNGSWARSDDRREGIRGNWGNRSTDSRRAEARDDRRNYADGYRDGRRNDNRWDGRNGNNNRRWDNRGWRNDNRYDWYRYRAANRSVFSPGRYYSPYRNYSYSRVNIGFRLGSLFYSNRYWINDPWQYRLPAAYGNYRWVRYYDDALLVDVYSGEVVDVINNFFW